MLQQTRVETVIPYYERWISRFPDVHALAQAHPDDVLKSWEGLGYYSRARNLHRAAQMVRERHQGDLPGNYQQLNALPGVGAYTAAAVASIAFAEPHAAVDGNVKRVLARIFDVPAPSLAELQSAADKLLDPNRPGAFNQAMMELGATVCLPKGPRCAACPVSGFCQGRQAGRQNELPVKRNGAAARRIDLHVAIVENQGRVLLRRRGDRESLMAGFWELPAREDLEPSVAASVVGSFRHTITHHRYTVIVSHGRSARRARGFRFWQKDRLDEIPLTTITRKALRLLPQPR